MINIFIFHRDLRLHDNTSLIKMLKDNKNYTNFIFPPEQIDPKKISIFHIIVCNL